MRFEELTQIEIAYIQKVYEEAESRKKAQASISDKFNVSERTVRRWAKRLNIGTGKPPSERKILIYDIETPRLKGEIWWSGKQWVSGLDIHDEPKIISISWKWVGEDGVYSDHWNIETQDDKEMLQRFLKDYNEADLVVGVNNNRFDNRWINARALKHGLDVNTFVRSLDIQKEAKRLLRLPSYALAYLAEYFNVPIKKMKTEGIIMWRKIQYSEDLQERKEWMQKMIEYNIHDILATEGVYLRMLPVLDHIAHLGVAYGNGKYSCPHCGETDNIELFKTTFTKAGTVQHIMKCNEDGTKYKISNREYLNWINL